MSGMDPLSVRLAVLGVWGLALVGSWLLGLGADGRVLGTPVAALRNDMDGVPGLTQRDIAPGADFAYRFAVPHPGAYWFHPHSGVQQDRGLYAPLIVEDPKEPLAYDKEWVVVLDDWVDGVDGSTPDAVLKELSGGMGGGMGATSKLLGGDAGDVAYPHYLVNGRVPQDPSSFSARPGDRIRLRIINAGGDTAFRVALGGHRMTVTHTAGSRSGTPRVTRCCWGWASGTASSSPPAMGSSR